MATGTPVVCMTATSIVYRDRRCVNFRDHSQTLPLIAVRWFGFPGRVLPGNFLRVSFLAPVGHVARKMNTRSNTE